MAFIHSFWSINLTGVKEELVDQAAGHNFYATLDMREAYIQIILDENSRDLTAFSDGITLYRFRRLPFRLGCSTAIFTRHMAILFIYLFFYFFIIFFLQNRKQLKGTKKKNKDNKKTRYLLLLLESRWVSKTSDQIHEERCPDTFLLKEFNS